MKKATLLRTSFVAVATALTLGSCAKKGNSSTTAESGTQAATGTQKIGYVEIDTLMSQYNFCKDYTLLMNKKGENIRTTLANKERALQQKAAELQRKYESNGFTTRDELEGAQMAIAKQQQDLQSLNDQLMNEFAMEQAKFNNQLRDSIQAFLKEYNKDKKFDFIISKAGDNLLIANPEYDVTEDIVKGLNSRYKTSPDIAEKISK